jgi:hypothetical protein
MACVNTKVSNNKITAPTAITGRDSCQHILFSPKVQIGSGVFFSPLGVKRLGRFEVTTAGSKRILRFLIPIRHM